MNEISHKTDLASTYKILCIGECMVEMQRSEDDLYKASYAGDTFNTAQYLAWLSQNDSMVVSYLTVLGRDRFGRSMLEEWKNNNIDTSLVMSTEEKNTGLYFADIDVQGNRDYTFFRSDSAAKLLFKMRHSEALFSKALDYNMVYISAITLMILDDEGREKLISFYKNAFEKGLTTVFDTNFRPSGWKSKKEAREWITALLPYVSIILPTDDENKELFGDYTYDHTIERFSGAGITEIVVKCGGEGCKIKYEGQNFSVPAERNVKVVDTTAAGDSFNAGYLYGRIQGQSPEHSARLGHRLASKVIGQRGAIVDVSIIDKSTV